jgi:hypothetical protein
VHQITSLSRAEEDGELVGHVPLSGCPCCLAGARAAAGQGERNGAGESRVISLRSATEQIS